VNTPPTTPGPDMAALLEQANAVVVYLHDRVGAGHLTDEGVVERRLTHPNQLGTLLVKEMRMPLRHPTDPAHAHLPQSLFDALALYQDPDQHPDALNRLHSLICQAWYQAVRHTPVAAP